jgi:hypothetical protein
MKRRCGRTYFLFCLAAAGLRAAVRAAGRFERATAGAFRTGCAARVGLAGGSARCARALAAGWDAPRSTSVNRVWSPIVC